ncbi:MAG: nplT [Steroidobacteraceae bacterium]|nr:nplT [Steroidobacteraceae bacterium]
MTKWLLSAALSLLVANVSAANGIEHLEPSFWWVGMKDNRLQLMVHGERIAELEPALEFPGVSIDGVIRTDNPNYLFIDLTLAESTRPGRFRIDFRRDSVAVLSHDYELLAREPGSAARTGFGSADVIYLVTPDRFANGDPGNDGIAGYRQVPNRRDPNGRHGGDLQGVLDHLDYIADMGFTQLWLNPVLQNDQPRGSYHGYAITDYYQVDARFGDNALYRSLSRAARAKDIGLIMDVVLNHCGSEHWWMRDLPAKDWINQGGQFVGTSHNRESLQDPHAAAADRDDMSDGWFVPTMPDLNQRNPLLATYLIQNSLWWIEYAGLSGLRVDTWPYSDKAFLTEWARRVMEEHPAINIVGEEWSTDAAIVSYWQRGKSRADGYASHLPSLMDFPLQDAAARAFVEEDSRTTGLISADLYKMAIAFFLTTRGIPQLFYGDEILMANPGTDAHGVIRSDFPGGWAGDIANGFAGTGLTAQQREAQVFTRKLLNWRKNATAIHRGKLTQYAPQDGVYVYFRHTDQLKVMVVINKSADAQRHVLEQGIRVAGRSVTVLDLQGDGPIPSGVTGQLIRHEKFASRYVDPRNVDVWLPPDYGQDNSRRLPVIYMHDGQNLFDPALSYIGVDWGIDEAMTRLIREGEVREAIVVGIWNTRKRAAEYVPQKALTEATPAASLPGVQELIRLPLVSDDYLRFLVEELKPFIDSTYRTLPLSMR